MNKNAMSNYEQNVLTGKDGEVWISTDGGITNICLGNADSFNAQLNVVSQDMQPLGSSLIYGVDTGYSITVTLSEIVIRDDILLDKIYEGLNSGVLPRFTLRGKLTRRDKKTHEQVFRNCKPESSVDLLNIVPGEIVKRPWTFRANATPALITSFKLPA